MRVNWSRQRWAATAGAIIMTIALPIAIDQGYFRHSVYALPCLGLVAGVTYIWLFTTSVKGRLLLRRFNEGFGRRHEVAGLLAVELSALVVIVLILLGFRIAVNRSRGHIADLEKSEKGIVTSLSPPVVFKPKPPLNSILDAFKEPTQEGIRLDEKPLPYRRNGSTVPIRLAVQFDNQSQTYSILIYIPDSPLSETICFDLAEPTNNVYLLVRLLVKHSDSFIDDDTPMPNNFYAIRNPRFSGTVIIYHDNKFDPSIKGRIYDKFKKHGMAVEFRGWDYVTQQNIGRILGGN